MTPRPTARTLFGRVAVLGVATLASAIVVAPAAAIAADDIDPVNPTGEPAAPGEVTEPDAIEPLVAEPESSPAEDAESTPGSTTDLASKASPNLASLAPQQLAAPSSEDAQVQAAAAPEPVFGFGKQRRYIINTQVKEGAFAPEGTTTVGSTFEIVTTLQDGTTSTASCTTVAATIEPQPPRRGFSTCLGETGGNTPLNLFTAPADATRVTITQTSAPENQALVVDPEPFVLLPCDESEVSCATTIRSTDFMEPGSILPVTVDDAITVTAGDEPVEVDVLANDTSDDPATTLTVTSPAAGQGTVRVVENEDGTMVLEYTPPADFAGDVAITYTVTNSNGSTDGTLNVTVEAPAVVVPPPVDNGDGGGVDGDGNGNGNGNGVDDTDDVAAEVPSNGDRGDVAAANGALPNAGGPGAELLAAGVLLVAAGGGLTVAARRRRNTGVHAS